jgi:ferredoxin
MKLGISDRIDTAVRNLAEQENQLSDQPEGVDRGEKETRVYRFPAQRAKPYSWGVRNTFQLVVLLLTLGIGFQFFIFVLQVSGTGAVTVLRPPGVEGFLPIGGLMGWKLFIQTGVWDRVHPAAMVILGFAGLISLVLRKSFCAWFCPVGTVSEWVWKFGRKIFGKNYVIPYWVDIPLRSLKYLILGFFLWTILRMSHSAIFAFLESPYYRVSDVKMLYFFTSMSALTAGVLLILVLSSIVVRNSWCRYLCPYGALMGLFSLLSPTTIRRNTTACIRCGKCAEVCPYHLPVDARRRIKSPECHGCMDCTLVCPVSGTLQLATAGFRKKAWSPLKLGVVIAGVYVVLVYGAAITGHWKSAVTEHELRVRLQEIHSPQYTHPGVRGK